MNRKYELGLDAASDEEVYDTHGNLIDDDYITQAVEDAHETLAGRPSLSGHNGLSPRVSFRLPTEVRDAAEQLAESESVSLSTLARRALDERVSRSNK